MLVFLLASCTSAEDEGRPGFPRTPRTPVVGAPYPYASPEEVGLSEDRIWWLKERLYSRIVARRVVGAEILVVKDRRIVLHQAMGWADRERLIPLERNAIFRIGSMTKPLAGTALLMLMEEGRIALDDRVVEYLSSFDNVRSRRITVRQLLTHRSGFAQGGLSDFRNQADLREAVNLAGETGPDFPPGDRFIYSNLNSAALGALVEKLTGEPVELFLEARLLRLLGLDDTHARFSPDLPWATRVPSSYQQWGGRRWERYWSNTTTNPERWFSPSGDLFSTAFDYARFLSAWLDVDRQEGGGQEGAPLLTWATVEEALADPMAGEGAAARERYYGFQWEVYAPPSRPGELPVFGHRGAIGTVGLAFPEENVLVLYLTQSKENEVVDEVIEMALEIFQH
ncbi:MAG: serine hydrolase domain-containing protein [Gemmatimonadota bacterium]